MIWREQTGYGATRLRLQASSAAIENAWGRLLHPPQGTHHDELGLIGMATFCDNNQTGLRGNYEKASRLIVLALPNRWTGLRPNTTKRP